MSLIEFSTRRPVTVLIFALAAVVFGGVGLQRLATDLLPDMTYPSLTVRTAYDGAAPIEVESLITRPIENAAGVVNGVTRVTSSSRADLSEVTLEFGWSTDMDFAGLEVRERLDVLELPDEADRPLLLRYDPALDPILRAGLFGSDDLVRLRLLAEEDVKRALERVEGVAGVVVSGGLEEEIQVELDERQLANLGLGVEQVVARLAAENVNLTGGRLLEGQSEYLVRTVNELVRAEDLERIVVLSSDEATVRVSDIARVVRGYKEREIVTRIDGRESVEVAVYKEGGTNTVAVARRVDAAFETLRRDLTKIDPALELKVVTSQARYIEGSVREVLKTAVYGGLLAILVLFFFLRSWRTTLIIGVAIPISVVATFFIMYVADVSLNIMSLGGLTLGIGLLVDNSIVVLEAIQRRRDEGRDEVAAAVEGGGEVGRAVVASTLTTICVFLPIVFVEGVAGQLFGDQALTVTFSLLVSLLVALSVIPMLASRRLASEPEAAVDDPEAAKTRRGALARWAAAVPFAIALGVARGVVFLTNGLRRVLDLVLAVPLRLFEVGFTTTASTYERLLEGALRRPALPVVAAVALLVASLLLVPRLGSELVPELVQGEFYVDVELPPGTRLAVTESYLSRLGGEIARFDGVETVYSIAGTSNEQGGAAGELRENLGQITLQLVPPTDRASEEAMMDRVRAKLDALGSLEYRFGRPSYFSFKTPVEVEIRGYNLELLKWLSARLTEKMQAIPGLTDVKSSTEGGNPELQINFDRERLASLDLSLFDIATTVRSKLQGNVATDIQRQDRTIDIRLRSAEAYRDSVRDLMELSVAQRSKTAIPLSAVADIVETEGPAEIRRAEGDRVAVISANLVGRDLASATREIERALAELEMPSGFDWQLSGQRQEMKTSFESLRMAILLAIFLVYLVMASQFESLLHPFVILFSVPFSLCGVLVTLALFGVTVSIVVLIGVVLLTGIVVNNAIILVDYTNRLRREEGLPKVEALRRAGRARLRPILMTTATTVLGLLPMAIGLGEGSELRSPMALTVIGGLVVSTLLTLLVIPATYALVDRR